MVKPSWIVVRKAFYKEGYTNRQHMLPKRDFESLIGKCFPTDMQALQAAQQLATSLDAPPGIDFVRIENIPRADIDAAIERACERGFAFQPFEASDLKVFIHNDTPVVALGYDHAPHGEATDSSATAFIRIYRPE